MQEAGTMKEGQYLSPHTAPAPGDDDEATVWRVIASEGATAAGMKNP
jgi:hypothetical protein